MEKTRNTNASRAIIGLILILFGSMFLADNLNILDVDLHPFFSWSSILFFVGLIIFFNSRSFAGIVLMFIGAAFFMGDFFDFHVWALWPLFLIFAGLNILVKRRTSKGSRLHQRIMRETEVRNDEIDEVAIFSGSEKSFYSDNFKGGRITAIFGGCELDLSRCKLAPGENILDMTTVFGGASLYLPADWKVICDVTPIFGGISDDRRRDPNMPIDEDKVLLIKGVVLFGGGELKTAKH